MPDWLTQDLNGIALWQLPLIIAVTFALGYVLTRWGGRADE
jgi:hypothetical protein